MSWHLITAAMAAVAIRHRPAEPQDVLPLFVASAPEALEMRAAPINPGWILSGNPQARVASHSDAEDGCAATGIWDCTAGEFRWRFSWDETVVILEGEVHVTAQDGTQRVLRAGDVAYFKGGTSAVWRIETYVRKVAFLRRPFPAPVAMLYRLRNALRQKPRIGIAA